MGRLDLGSFQALTFDCYGTLIDWETGIVATLRAVLGEQVAELTAEDLLTRYAGYEAAAESGSGGHLPYRAVLGRVMERFGSELGVDLSPDDRAALAESLPGWPPFDDTVSALQRLGTRYRLGILSNVDDDLFAGTQRRLEVEFEWIVTAQQVGSYKPSERNFQALLERVALPPARLLHAAQSRYHDIQPASRLGISTVWVDRCTGRSGAGATLPVDAGADLVVPDLQTLAFLAGL